MAVKLYSNAVPVKGDFKKLFVKGTMALALEQAGIVPGARYAFTKVAAAVVVHGRERNDSFNQRPSIRVAL